LFGAFIALVTGLELQVCFVEEPYLRRTHGSAYLRYAARAGRFIPGVGTIKTATVRPRPDVQVRADSLTR
jgi:hypothetical protein